jgi:hypothetical protein
VLEEFAGLDQYYPGSRERRQTVPASRPSAVEEVDLLGDGTVMTVRGHEVEFFTIGQVARAINRKAGTLRAWEDRGILPESGYVKRGKDVRGDRRLYSRAQAEGIIRLAKASGVMDAESRRPLHDFSAWVWALFNELKGDR